MTTYTNINKPSGTAYTNLNTIGKEQYDQTNIEYDDADIFYDGVNRLAYTNVPNPSVAWNISLATLESSLDISARTTRPEAIFFKPDGLKMYVADGQSAYTVLEYDLSTAWDVTTGVYLQSFVPFATYPNSLFFKSDGTKMYIPTSNSGIKVYEFALSTAWDISTASVSQIKTITDTSSNAEAIFFSPDGLRMHVGNNTTNKIDEYNLNLAWDISTVVYNTSFSVASQTTSPDGVFFRYDGKQMYIVSAGAVSAVYEYFLSEAWDITTCTFLQSFTYTPDSDTFGIFFKPNGFNVYITTAWPTAKILQFSMSDNYTKITKPT